MSIKRFPRTFRAAGTVVLFVYNGVAVGADAGGEGRL
jgi:hypothetical protein